jgi:hypothetical protein
MALNAQVFTDIFSSHGEIHISRTVKISLLKIGLCRNRLVFPVVFRPFRSRCACSAPAKERVSR